MAKPALNALQNNITASLVANDDRLNFLPNFFGRHMLRAETLVYSWMESLCGEYKGGYWNFYTLSNGGCYMAPHCGDDRKLHLMWIGNNFDDAVSADAAGIIATLFGLCHLTESTCVDKFADFYHYLRDYASEHPERSLIFRAID
jgi:hypothetical protein